jgi:peptidoglycan biosynthesis protein MviN/MurJ (putative lipid II flippase)
MTLLQWVRRNRTHPALLIGATLFAGGLFKLSAFAREAFIAARFGLSTVTDTYFGLQQFPLTLATFMFGAFSLAFTPAYAEARRRSDSVSWLPGLTLYGCLLGALLTVLMLVSAPWLLRLFSSTPSAASWNTLALLSLCYLPIFFIGVAASIYMAEGSNLSAMTITGLPYLVMTLALLALYAAHALNNLGLPISMTVGFALVGLYASVRVIGLNVAGSKPGMPNVGALWATWRQPDFRAFLRELGASSIENLGYAGNQLLILFFLARAGTGAISANTCGMRVGLIGYSLLAQPLAQLVQARLCAVDSPARPAVFRRWFLLVASGVFLMALFVYVFRVMVIRLVYMHGKFQNTELNEVAAMLPPWIGYFIVMSLNAIVTRYMFTDNKGTIYVRRQLGAYGAANILRLLTAAAFGPAWIIWCSVLTEASVMVLNLRTCLFAHSSQPLPELVGVEEA